MYTHTINKIENKKAFVTLHKDTGETEIYTEQVPVSEAVFATEETPFIPPVFELVEHTRPKITNTDIIVTFEEESEIAQKIQDCISEIENPTVEQVPEQTPEQIAQTEAILKKFEFLQKLAEWDAQRVAGLFVTSRGGTISQEDGQEFYALEQWLFANWKKEYALEAKQYLSALGLSS